MFSAISKYLKFSALSNLDDEDNHIDMFKSWRQNYNLMRRYNSFISNEQILENPSVSDKKQITIVRHQICFLLDITGSMNPWIKGVKNQISSMIKDFRSNCETFITDSENQKLVFEVSIVGYRDFSDKTIFEVHDFTTETKHIEKFLSSLKANGGGDWPEDVKGSFIYSTFGIDGNKLSWNEDTSSKILLWIADSPPHGMSPNHKDDFHDGNMNEWKNIFSHMKKWLCLLFISHQIMKKQSKLFKNYLEITKSILIRLILNKKFLEIVSVIQQ